MPTLLVVPMHLTLLHDALAGHGNLPLCPPDLPVQPPVLQVRQHGKDQAHGGQGDNGGPAGLVQGLVVALEQLAADDTGGVGGHDEEGHGDAALAGGAGVEGEPGAVDGVVGHGEGEGEGEDGVAGVVIFAMDEGAVGDGDGPPDEHAEQHERPALPEVVRHQAPADVHDQRDPAADRDERVGDQPAVAEGADERGRVRVERVVGRDGGQREQEVGVHLPVRKL